MNLFGEDDTPPIDLILKSLMRVSKAHKVNPMVLAFGAGPTEHKCKACAHFYRKQYAKTYFKCAFRGDTNGLGTDHRANWPTCSKFTLGCAQNSP